MTQVPGWKTVCTLVGATFVLLASTMLFGGFQQMAAFGVPVVVLASPHAADLHHWLFVHTHPQRSEFHADCRQAVFASLAPSKTAKP